MKNKKIMAIVAAVIVVLLLSVILFLNRHKNTENIITRYDGWKCCVNRPVWNRAI